MVDYEFWDSLEELTLDQAAYLWCEQEPKLSPRELPAKVLAVSNMLYAAAQHGEIQSRDTSRMHTYTTEWEREKSIFVVGETYLNRNSLRAYAESKGYRPKFLFPGTRTTEPDKIKSLRNSQTHRARCRAIAEILWAQRPDMTISEVIESDEITVNGCERIEYSLDTRRDWIKELCPNRSPGRRPKK